LSNVPSGHRTAGSLPGSAPSRCLIAIECFGIRAAATLLTRTSSSKNNDLFWKKQCWSKLDSRTLVLDNYTKN
jgi:hypothetical protein